MNLQPPEKRAREVTGSLSVHSIFYTIQGEGPFAGTPAVFVRLAGCNLQCPLCDTDYTSDSKLMQVTDVVRKIEELHTCLSKDRLVVITGGEPFRQPGGLKELVQQLFDAGFYCQIETNGSLPIKGFECGTYPQDRYGCYIVVSPKTGTVHKSVWQNACCVKYVGDHTNLSDTDGLPTMALAHPNSPMLARQPPKGWQMPIYLQPTDFSNSDIASRVEIAVENNKAMQACLQSCIVYGYTLQLQIHKIIGVP